MVPRPILPSISYSFKLPQFLFQLSSFMTWWAYWPFADDRAEEGDNGGVGRLYSAGFLITRCSMMCPNIELRMKKAMMVRVDESSIFFFFFFRNLNLDILLLLMMAVVVVKGDYGMVGREEGGVG